MGESMESTKEQLLEQFIDLTQQMYAQVRSEPTEEWTELELTMPQFRTLMLLTQGPQRMGAIAGQMSSSLSAATGMIDRLVDKGLVERVPHREDRRVVACQLTPQGRDEIDRLWRISRLRIGRIAAHLTTEELGKVVEAMRLLYRAGQRAAESS